jgi:hypothetical protein
MDDAVALVRHAAGPDRVDADPAATAELAEACGRLPLALRIAAANARVRPGPGSTANGTAVRLGTCGGGQNQKWTGPAATTR